MRSFAETPTTLLMTVVCVGAASCTPTGTQSAAEVPKTVGSDGRMNVESQLLATDQILDAANTTARECGWNLEKFRVFFDEDNAWWRSKLSGVRVPEVEGHDFQVVMYTPREPAEAEDRIIVVDKNTGDILAIVGPKQEE